MHSNAGVGRTVQAHPTPVTSKLQCRQEIEGPAFCCLGRTWQNPQGANAYISLMCYHRITFQLEKATGTVAHKNGNGVARVDTTSSWAACEDRGSQYDAQQPRLFLSCLCGSGHRQANQILVEQVLHSLKQAWQKVLCQPQGW